MRIFCPKPLSKQPIYSGFLFRVAPHERLGGLFKENLPANFFENEVEYCSTPEDAEAIILPNNFVSLDIETEQYIKTYADQAEKFKKPVYIFACGDFSDSLQFDPRVQVFKYSLYCSTKKLQEICAPTLTEDIGRTSFLLRQKSDLPVVSFCGKASFATKREWLASFLRRLKYEVLSIITPTIRAHIRGVYWRMWVLSACKGSPLIKTLFIVRKTFSGAASTIELPPVQAREEFINSITESDFVLASKGDGNYSNRFLEALSMGRIPVVVDTDIVLPFEDKIDYEKIMVRVPMNQISKTPEYVHKFYNALSPQEWETRQKLARETFEKYLRQDSFFRTYFSLHTLV